jgi:hypothetical protein
MTKRASVSSGLGYFLVGLVSLCLVSGCPVPEQVLSWLRIDDSAGNDITGKEVVVVVKQWSTFHMRGSVDLVSQNTTWVVEDGSRTHVGAEFTHSFPNTGTYKVTVIGNNSHLVESWFYVRVVASAAEVVSPTVIVFNSNSLVFTGGTRQGDGSIRVVLGGTLTLDCSGALSGGVAPYEIYWIENGAVFARGVSCNIPCGNGGTRTITLRIVDAQGMPGEWDIVVVVVVVEVPPPPASPTIHLTANGQDSLMLQADASHEASFKMFWTTTNATRVDVSVSPASSLFQGQRAVVNESGGESITLGEGVWTFSATATGAAGTSPASDSVTVTIMPFVSNQLCITSAAFSGTQPFHVGQQVTVTVYHTGVGIIHHLMATSTVVGSITPSASGVTTFTYRWPFATGTGAESFIWPDDRDAPPDIIVIPTMVNP